MSSCLHLFVFMFMICVGGVGLFDDPVSTRVETRRDQLFAAKTELEFKRSCCLASLSPCPSDRDFDFPCLWFAQKQLNVSAKYVGKYRMCVLSLALNIDPLPSASGTAFLG